MMEFESGFLQSFLQQLPEKLPAAHKQYASWLGEDMQKRHELILDFNGLQASLDPVPNLSQFIGEEEESEQKVILLFINNNHYIYIYIYNYYIYIYI